MTELPQINELHLLPKNKLSLVLLHNTTSTVEDMQMLAQMIATVNPNVVVLRVPPDLSLATVDYAQTKFLVETLADRMNRTELASIGLQRITN